MCRFQRSLSTVVLLVALVSMVPRDVLAATAWVLWVQETVYWGGKGTTWGSTTRKWRIADAYTDKVDCDGNRRVKLLQTIEFVKNPEHHPHDTDVWCKVEGEVLKVHYTRKDATPTDPAFAAQDFFWQCLPDTVDPRPPSR
jgi:hypothetical protein